MLLTSRPYGVTKDGQQIDEFTIKNGNGLTAVFINYGCILTHLYIPDRNGNIRDIVLGYDTLEEYEKDTSYFGAFVGRFANRIKDSTFELHGRKYHMEPNDGLNHLHGVLSKRAYQAIVTSNSLSFSYHSPDGEDGLPGAVDFNIVYMLDDNNILTMKYQAMSNCDTILNLTNHSYFNLNGHENGSVKNHLLQIEADEFLETADDCCPTGHILPVDNTPMDFRHMKRIGQGLDSPCEQMELVGGYDHCYVLKEDAAPACYAYSDESGIALQIMTSQPGVQLYSGNFLDGSKGKGGAVYGRNAGFALETEHYPCSPNYPQFPSTLVRKGELIEETTMIHIQTISDEETK